MITIGIDPHKRSLTAAALDPHSRLLSQLRLPTTGQAAQQLLTWAAAWPERRWAVEGASGLGRGIAQFLVAAGEPVVDVPAKLAARARLLGTSSARKTDLADAASVATAAIYHRRLRPVALEDQTVILRLLSDRRDDLVAERTRTLSRLHVLLADLHPGGATRELTAARAAAVLRQVRPITMVDIERKRIAGELLADVRRLDRQVKTASQAIRTAIGEHGTTLTEVYGIGPVLAAKLLAHAGDITRFPDRDHFASYTGTAPVEASSGDVRRHRLNRGGNRQLNTALHLIAVCQIRDPSPSQAYYQRKLIEAKTPEEARRSLIGGVSGAQPAQESGLLEGAGQGTAPMSCHPDGQFELCRLWPRRAIDRLQEVAPRGPSIRHRRQGSVHPASNTTRANRSAIDVCRLGLGQCHP